MKAPASAQNGPDAGAIRAQVQRMTASHVFANSPQLSAFLVFVVEAVLRGQSERLKGYTIGVEVLRRDVSFDPQIDPIVRVEATRLRRALERYYAGPGAEDVIAISLPRGGYVPRIGKRTPLPGAVASARAKALPPGNGLPTLRVAPFVVIGTADTRLIDGDTLGSRLAEALALFESVNVIAAAPPASARRYDYRLDGTLEYREGGASLRFKLVDKSDETVIWSRAFDPPAESESAADFQSRVTRDVAVAIAQRFGVIWSHARARLFTPGTGDPRYRALVEAGDVLRTFDRAAYARMHQELERITRIDPGFAVGVSTLAIVYAVEYVHGFGDPEDASALDRALKTARRAVELKPDSAFAYHVLFVIMFLRGENEAAAAAAEKAAALNPYDATIPMDYGGRLVFAGELDRGMAILREAVPFGAILPSWSHLYLFLGHYLRDELAEARFHAGQMTSEMHIYGQLARALIAHRDGRGEEARGIIEAIQSSQPHWKANPRREIGKLITAPVIADRLARELAEAGRA